MTFTWSSTPGEKAVVVCSQTRVPRQHVGSFRTLRFFLLCVCFWEKGTTFYCSITHTEKDTNQKHTSWWVFRKMNTPRKPAPRSRNDIPTTPEASSMPVSGTVHRGDHTLSSYTREGFCLFLNLYKWTHRTYTLLCLTSPAEHFFYVIHPCCCML